MANPIKYSDLVIPDDSITKLVGQLRELDETYSQALKNIREEAARLVTDLKGVSGATEEGRKATKAAATDADRLAKANERLTYAQSENAAELEKVNQAIREAQRLTKLTTKLNDAAEGSYDKLSAQYSLNKIRLNAMSKAEREATKEGRELESQTKDLYEEMKRLQSATGKEQLNVGNYPDMTNAIAGFEERLLSVIGLNGEYGRSLVEVGRGGEASIGIFKGMGSAVSALGKTLMGLLANPVFLAVAGIAGAGAAFKWWYDYNAGLQEATRLTQQFTDKEGEDLRNFRGEVQAVAETFNKDFREVLVATNAVSKQFGISQDEALTLVRDGFVAGADANGEFLDTLREYPAYFREAGLSAEDFIAIVAQTSTSGIFSDKGVDAIKEANIRLREMTTATAEALDGIGISSAEVQRALSDGSKTTFEVMQMVSAKLAELPESSSKVGTAIADIFGGPGEDAGYRYLTTLKDIETEMDVVKSRAGELGAVQERQLQSQVELQNTVNALFDRTGGVFEMLIGNAKIFVNKSLTSILRGVINVVNYFIDWYNNLLIIRFAVSTVVSAFQVAFRVIGAGLGIIGDLIGGLGNTIQGIWKGIIGEGWDQFKQGLNQIALAVPQAVQKITNAVAEEVVDVYENTQKRIKPITIPVSVEGDTSSQGSASSNAVKAATEDAKKAEEVYQNNLKARRAKEDAELALEKDSWEKKRKEINNRYDREIEDLQHRLKTEKNLSETARADINATITALRNKQSQEIAQSYTDEAEEWLNLQYEQSLSEIDLLQTTEDEKTRLRLEAEKKRLEQLLKLGKYAGEEEKKIIENTIKGIQNEINNMVPTKDIYDILGFKLNDGQKDAINTSLGYAKQAVSEYLSLKEQAARESVAQADDEVEAAQRVLDAELQARANGYANNVEQAQKELDLAKRTQAKALEEQRKAQRAQEAINTLQQVSDLVTASARIWAELGPLGAIPALATMWGSFAYSKVKAKQLATEQYGEGTVELLEGGSHASGHDIDLGMKADGTRRRAEGGEFFAVINKRNSARYRSIIPSLINSLNDGTFERYVSAFKDGGIEVNVAQDRSDLSGLGRDVRAIKEQGLRREYSVGSGRVRVYKNLKQRLV